MIDVKKSKNNQKKPVYKGKIIYWNDEKGFGFIKYSNKKENLFFHISTFAYQNRRPQKGDVVFFVKKKTQTKREQAMKVVLEADKETMFSRSIQDIPEPRANYFEAIIYAIIIIFFYVILLSFSWILVVSSLLISVLTAILYKFDKKASYAKRQRIPEASLHIAALLGGWPGALLTRTLIRHKTKKIRFVIFFWMSSIVNFAILYFIISYIYV